MGGEEAVELVERLPRAIAGAGQGHPRAAGGQGVERDDLHDLRIDLGARCSRRRGDVAQDQQALGQDGEDAVMDRFAAA